MPIAELPLPTPGHGRRLLATGTAAALMAAGWLTGAPAASAAVTPSCVAAVCTVSFPASSATTWVVPDAVTSVRATLGGGEGGGWSPIAGDVGGAGGQLVATIPVTPGDTLTGVVGDAGSPAGNQLSSPSTAAYGGGGVPPCRAFIGISCGGGGGGGSFLFAATGPAAPRLLAAAGGGGAGGVGVGVANGDAGGAGGAGSGAAADGHDGQDKASSGASGGGGTQTSGGAGHGTYGFIGTDGGGPATGPDTLGKGGTGTNGDARVGAGGGGYYGGGGSGYLDAPYYSYGAAGGGSGFLITGAVVDSTGTNSGAGTVTLTYTEPSATTTTLQVSPTAPTAGKSITLTAMVTASLAGSGQPSGTAEFFDGSTSLGQAAVTTGAASLSSTLTAGVHHLTVHYLGGTGFLTSTSPVITVTVRTAATPTPTATGGTTTPTPTHSNGATTSTTSGPGATNTSSGAGLAATGSPTQPMIELGLLLLLGGSGALFAARQREARHH